MPHNGQNLHVGEKNTPVVIAKYYELQHSSNTL